MADRVDTPDPRKIRSAIEREVNAIMTDVLAEAKRQTPRDKSTLVRSAVKDVQSLGDRIEVRITFNTPYAARQHEERSYKHPRGGKAKYLEDPMRAMAGQVERRLAAAYRRALS